MSSIPPQQHSPPEQEIADKLRELNEAYMRYMQARDALGLEREAFDELRLWFDVRKIALLHREPRDKWTLA